MNPTGNANSKLREILIRDPDGFFVELQQPDRLPAAAVGAEDPGSPAFTMTVRDIDAAVDQWTKAGGTVVTTGGKAIKRANGAGNVFVRDVKRLYVGIDSARRTIE